MKYIFCQGRLGRKSEFCESASFEEHQFPELSLTHLLLHTLKAAVLKFPIEVMNAEGHPDD